MIKKKSYSILKRVEINFCPFFILFFLSTFSYGQYTFSKECENAYNEILKLKIKNGKSLLQNINNKESKAIVLYLENYADVISVFISDELKQYEALYPASNGRVEQISKMDKKSPYYLFILSEIKLQWAFIKIKFGDEVAGMWDIRQAYLMLEENNQKFPDFLPNKKTFGIMNILVGSVPDKYTWVTNVAGMRGNISTGIKLLEDASSKPNPFNLEASIIKIAAENYILSKEDISIANISALYKENNDNLLLAFLNASILMKNSHDEEALNVLSQRPVSDEYIIFPYLHLMEGDILLHKGNYQEAIEKYALFLKDQKGSNFIKDAYYKLFLCFWLNNENARAEKYLKKVLYNGKAVYDADRYAQQFAERNELPDKNIMKCRLFTDGGYYEEALTLFNSIQSETLGTEDKVEYTYRLGRLYQKTGELTKAIECYEKTIAHAPTEGNYFGPNACLQLGYLYRNKDREKAKKYFEQALSYKNYHYKNSIDNKARGALNELR
ncbi:MAG: tetratricopeptide repeat protein [Cytophagaceae bacterium]